MCPSQFCQLRDNDPIFPNGKTTFRWLKVAQGYWANIESYMINNKKIYIYNWSKILHIIVVYSPFLSLLGKFSFFYNTLYLHIVDVIYMFV